jgi:hypothetical protein
LLTGSESLSGCRTSRRRVEGVDLKGQNANILAYLNSFLRVPAIFSLEAGKLFMMWQCGCQVDEFNNWVSQAMKTPWFWRTAADGTRFVAGPYSSLWYWLNWPAHYGYWSWMSYLWAVDLAITIVAFSTRSWKFLVPYMMSSIYFYNIDPIDLFIFWFSITPLLFPYKRYAALGPVIAVAVKFPVDAPGYVWTFIFHNPYGVNEPGGLLRYGQMGAWFVSGIALYLYRWRRSRRLACFRIRPWTGETSALHEAG